MDFNFLDADEELDCVIEAIDVLRSRRNRPDFSGISRYLMKSYGISSDKTVSLIDVLIVQNRLKQVLYKGKTSYRNLLNWRQPIKTYTKKIDTCSSGSAVLEALKLLEEDWIGERGISEARLQAALIGKSDGTVTLDEIRNQIKVELDKGAILKNDDGNFILRHDLVDNPINDMESSIDSSMFGDARETSPALTNESSLLDSTFNTHDENSCIENSNNVINMNESSQNTNSSSQLTFDMSQTEDKFVEPTKILNVSSQDSSGQVEELGSVVHIHDTKKRRIKKKTIYDPSVFEMALLVKKKHKKKRNSLDVTVVAGPVKERRGRPRKSTWSVTKVPVAATAKSELEHDLKSTVEPTPPAPEILSNSKQKRRNRLNSANDKQCCICLKVAVKNQQPFISCSLCLNTAHQDCVKIESFYIGTKKWRCDECKEYNPAFCCVCEENINQSQYGSYLMCDFCEEFYHCLCHSPPVHLPLLYWRCSTCPAFDNQDVNLDQDGENSIVKSNSSTTDQNSPDSSPPSKAESVESILENKCNINENCDIVLEPLNLPMKIEPNETDIKEELKEADYPNLEVPSIYRHKPDEPIPRVDDWTVQQVSNYFMDKFGQDVADAFLSLAIDGKSLKKLSRQEVTNDLGLQLGIALKVLYYVKKIQLGTNILQQLWD